MTKKRHKLADSIAKDYCLLGIVSDEPEYKLTWSMNEVLQTSFQRMEDLSLYHKKGQSEQRFSLYLYEEENTMLTYRIIRNRSENGYFLSDLKNIDYVIHIQGELDTDRVSDFIRQANQLDTIRMCIPIELSKLKDRSRLSIW